MGCVGNPAKVLTLQNCREADSAEWCAYDCTRAIAARECAHTPHEREEGTGDGI